MMKSNAPEVAMGTVTFELFATNPAHKDSFSATPLDEGTLEKACQKALQSALTRAGG